MKRILRMVKDNKSVRYLVLSLVLILFCFALTSAFAIFTSQTTYNAYNISVAGLNFGMTIDGSSGSIISAPANTKTGKNIVITLNDKYDAKYELTYKVCSTSSCTSFIDKPNNLEVYYSSQTVDQIAGSISVNGSKAIRIVIKNNTSTSYYIKLSVNAGFSYNTLELEDAITDVYVEDDLYIVAHIDGETSQTFPTTKDYSTSVTCTNDGAPSSSTGTVTWNTTQTKWQLSLSNIQTGETKCDAYFTYIPPAVASFDYTGGIQTFTVPYTGTYKLEVWGAQGGQGKSGNSSSNGGYGAYATGEVSLTQGQILYVVVGGQGGTGTQPGSRGTATFTDGGYNGGGRGYNSYYNGSDGAGDYASGGGGGATHIAKVNGLLSNLSSNQSDILIVAGGGGGGQYVTDPSWGTSYGYAGGNGGGKKGTDGEYYSSWGEYGWEGSAGDQETGGLTHDHDQEIYVDLYGAGSFGQGGDADISEFDYWGIAGGGGGFYGGGVSNAWGSGGGGSGFIGNSLLSNKEMYCYRCTTDNNTNTKTSSTTSTNATATSNTPKIGNGYAIITRLS